MRENETERGVLSPVAVAAVGGLGCAEEGAMAAMRGFEQRDVRVGLDDGKGFGQEADEGVVTGVNEQRGDGDAIEDARCGGAKVVVVGGLEARVERGDAVIEVAQGPDASGQLRIVSTREERGLAAEALEQSAQEFALVDAV